MRLMNWLAALSLFAAAPAAAQVVDVATDFNTAQPTFSNSGLVAYGYYPTGTSTTVLPYDLRGSCFGGQATCANATGIDALGVSRLNTGLPDGIYGGVTYKATQLNLHPGPNGEQALVIFTAPTSDTYRFVGAYEAHNGGTTYNIAYGNTDRSTTVLAGFQGDRTFDFNRTMASGEQNVFLLDRFGDYSFDTTGFGLQVFDSSVAAAPEPAAWGLMITGFGLAGGTLRRRRRSPRSVLIAA